MKTVTIETYQFSELSDKAKERARDWMRGCLNQDTDYADTVVSEAKDLLRHCGFWIQDIFWSGFCCQGDGACLVGTWYASDVKPGKIRGELPTDSPAHNFASDLERIAKAYPNAFMKIEHTGRYYHEYSCAFTFENGDGEELPDEACEELKDAARDAMRWIYKWLESEYEYQTSDENVEATIEANEYAFTKDGNRT